MTYATGTLYDFHTDDLGRLPRRRSRRGATLGSAALACGVLLGAGVLGTRPAVDPGIAQAPVAVPPNLVAWNANSALLDPTLLAGFSPAPLAESAPRGSNFEFVPPPPPAVLAQEPTVAPPLPPVVAQLTQDAPLPSRAIVAQSAQDIPLPPRPIVVQMAQDVPLPAPRPPGLRPVTRQVPLRLAGRRMAPQNGPGVAPPVAPDNRSFVEKLFGLGQPAGPALGYAAPETDFFGAARRLTASPAASYDRWTAVYDISAHTVYMPSGARLEAHSGLGDKLDDPRHVNVQNRGATPPQVYDLKPREQLFHGVQALRLTPADGGGVYGRTGLLAHTYMLGPNGDSNGCVSFKNYDAFLQAYQAGEVRRLAVVARLN